MHLNSKMWRYLTILVTCAAVVLGAQKTIVYDNFLGTPVTEEEMMQYGKDNKTSFREKSLITCAAVVLGALKTVVHDNFLGTLVTDEEDTKISLCTTEIKPCDPNEGRRLDGSCNNLAHPSRGVARTPFIKLLPSDFGEGFEPRPSESGASMPLERHLRSAVLATGTLPDLEFTQLAMYFFLSMSLDITSVEDSSKFVKEKINCCHLKGKTDSMCTPLKVPEDDPVYRYSNIRCLDLTRPTTFQSSGCLRSGTSPERFVTATPAFDLSEIYGSELKKSLGSRLYTQGLLKYDVEDGRKYPPQNQNKPSPCRLNELPRETRCHDTPDDATNLNIGHNLMVIWFWRNHNRIASTLAGINPCWDDERLFQTARDINIAAAMQIFFYEFLPILFGREYLVRDSVISSDPGFRDMYDNNLMPQTSLEFPYVLRWGHLMIDSRLKMYDGKGKYLKQIPMVNLTLRTGYLAVDDNMDSITQGSFRQASGKIDTMVDADIANRVHGSDLFSIDLAKGRYLGFQPYIKYREYCSGQSYKTFEDLADLIDEDKLELLKDLYGHVNDVELMAGLWLENPIEGGRAPQTLYCVVVEQLLRNIKFDRHWYERANRPNAFTMQQLQEIRKATISGFLCEVGDKVTHIQRSGFVRSGPRNEIVSCSEIQKSDLKAWKDLTCEK